MRKLFLLSFYVFAITHSFAQRAIVITELPANTPVGSMLYLGASANGWNPGLAAWSFGPAPQPVLSIPVEAPSSFEGKVTRGSWTSAEGNASGNFLPNRIFNFSDSDTLFIAIQSWEDVAAGDDLPPNLFTVSDDFFMPQLDRSRRVQVLLPTGYEQNPTLHYPVLYMHDGQNLFSASEAFSGEWKVDEAMDDFENDGYTGAIIIAIDNGGSFRISEYTPWANPNYGGGEGIQYVEFIVNTLKPNIDENYRTLADRDNTGLMGSSLGGLISHYAGIKYPEVFSKIGVFSPSYWFTDDIYPFTESQGHTGFSRFYFLAGGQESATLEGNMDLMLSTMEGIGFSQAELNYTFVMVGEHSEWFWAQEFPAAFEWLFIDTTTGLEESEQEAMQLFPNPAGDSIMLKLPEPAADAQVTILDMQGRRVLVPLFNAGMVDVALLQSGSYLVEVKSNDRMWTAKFIKK